jgi:hypothetical protein
MQALEEARRKRRARNEIRDGTAMPQRMSVRRNRTYGPVLNRQAALGHKWAHYSLKKVELHMRVS